MYVDNYEFKDWMQKLLDKLEEVGKDVKSLQTNPEVMPNDKLLDNQDLCLLFKVSTRTLQRLRSKKLLPFMMISGKAYYRASDVREFIKVRCGHAPKVRERTRKRISKSEIHPETVHVTVPGCFFFWQVCIYFPADIVPSSL
nr:helix-turn-helix domain-containing protein [Bacteroides fragilis]